MMPTSLTSRIVSTPAASSRREMQVIVRSQRTQGSDKARPHHVRWLPATIMIECFGITCPHGRLQGSNLECGDLSPLLR
jgi:hypothetical protein